MRRTLLLATAFVLAAPATAHAAGGPIAGNTDAGHQGAVVPGDPQRVVAVPAGRNRTLVGLVQRRGGELWQTLALRGRFTVPGVATDGTPDGRSADGQTVVLVPPPHSAFPRRRSRFLVLTAHPLRVSDKITLRGEFSFDALSPDGRRMYLIQYTDPDDPRRYAVRSYDLERRRLERGAIVDAREPDEQMRGYPMTRVTSADGRWAYTLYDGVGEPFIHALDTARRRAFCIDLPMLADTADPMAMRLGIGERGVSVLVAGRPLAVVDSDTMHAHEPPRVRPGRPRQKRPRRTAGAGAGGDGGGAGTATIGVAVAAALTVGAAASLRRRRRRSLSRS